MKSRIVADGPRRILKSPEFQAKLQTLHESIRARYTSELSSGSLFRRSMARWQVAIEFHREQRKLRPSLRSLYTSVSFQSKF